MAMLTDGISNRLSIDDILINKNIISIGCLRINSYQHGSEKIHFYLSIAQKIAIYVDSYYIHIYYIVMLVSKIDYL